VLDVSSTDLLHYRVVNPTFIIFLERGNPVRMLRVDDPDTLFVAIQALLIAGLVPSR